MNKIKYVLFVSVICLVFVTNSIVAKADEATLTVLFSNCEAIAEDGSLSYFEVDSSGVEILTPFPDDYDMNGDGLVKVEDIQQIISSVDTSFLYDIKSNVDGVTEVDRIAYGLLNDKLELGLTDSELDACADGDTSSYTSAIENIDTLLFLDNYSYLVCLYSMCSGENINTLKDGQLWDRSLEWVDTSVDNFFTVKYWFVSAEITNSLTNLSGTTFPGDVEEADDNWYSNTGTQNPEDQNQTSEEQFVVQDDASDWLRDIVETDMRDDGVLLPDGSDLTSSDKVQLGLWLTSVQFGKEDSWFQTLRVVRIIVGIICIVYSVFFFLCYWLDKVNNIFDISFLGLISLGRFVASADDGVSTYRGKSKEPKLLSLRDVLMVSIGILLLGVLILTGTLYIIVVTILDKLNSLLGGL